MLELRAKIEPLTWESQFFSCTTAKLTSIGELDAPLITNQQLEQFQRVHAKVSVTNYELLDCLQQWKFSLVEGEIDSCFELSKNENNDTASLSIATNKDIGEVKKIAAEAFRFSRFRLPWYSQEKTQQFYALWAEKAILGSFDHICLVVKGVNQQILGFVTLKLLAENEARIGLLAVAEQARKQGVAQQLIVSAFSWCKKNSVQRLYVATQMGNLPAIRLYQQAGAMIINLDYWFYR